jgi:hypothetical protein
MTSLSTSSTRIQNACTIHKVGSLYLYNTSIEEFRMSLHISITAGKYVSFIKFRFQKMMKLFSDSGSRDIHIALKPKYNHLNVEITKPKKNKPKIHHIESHIHTEIHSNKANIFI